MARQVVQNWVGFPIPTNTWDSTHSQAGIVFCCFQLHSPAPSRCTTIIKVKGPCMTENRPWMSHNPLFSRCYLVCSGTVGDLR